MDMNQKQRAVIEFLTKGCTAPVFVVLTQEFPRIFQNNFDYYAWGAVEKCTNRSACNTKAELVAKIKVFEDLSRDTVKNACARFRSRLEAGMEAEGGYFE